MYKLFAFCALSALFFSCKKEGSNEDPNAFPPIGGGGSSSAKLLHIGAKSGSDTATLSFTYTTSNRISSFNITETDNNGQPIAIKTTFERNSSNVIIKDIYEDPELAQYGLSNLVTNHNYDAATSRYKYSLTLINIFTFSLRDSTAYTYDASGKLITAISYINDGTGYEPYSKEEYTYSGSNVGSIKIFEFDDQVSNYVLYSTQTFEYDTKANPLQFTADAVILRRLLPLNYAHFYSANNITKETQIATDPPSTTVTNNIYTYGSNNRPATSVMTSGNVSTTFTYHYQ